METTRMFYNTYATMTRWLMIEKDVEKLENIVQYNSEFFGCKVGDMKLAVLADWLEDYVNRHK